MVFFWDWKLFGLLAYKTPLGGFPYFERLCNFPVRLRIGTFVIQKNTHSLTIAHFCNYPGLAIFSNGCSANLVCLQKKRTDVSICWQLSMDIVASYVAVYSKHQGNSPFKTFLDPQ